MMLRVVISAMVIMTAAQATAQPTIDVDPADLAIGSAKYVGKNIRIRSARCYFADVGDYRCTTPELVSVFTKSIEPEISRKWVEEHCDTIRKVERSQACKSSITFTYESAEQDKVDGFQTRTIILTPQINFLFPRR